MEYTPSTEIDLAPARAAAPAARRGFRAAAAALLAAGMAGTFAVPAYAITGADDANVLAVRTGNAQGLVISDAAAAAQPLVSVEVTEIEKPKAAEATATQAQQPAAAQQTEAAPAAEAPKVEVPAVGGKAGALLAAAYAQVGINQDCTDMVQNALAAIGIGTRRDQGGYDHGVQDFLRYGTIVPSDQAQPGDIMVNGGHVAIYAGNNTAVHGGWLGFQTKVFAGGGPSSPFNYTIVRLP